MTLESVTPALSIHLWNFSTADPGPGGWQPLLDRAAAADRAGIDRIVVSDHVVFGENLEAYADPRAGGVAGGRQPTGPDGHWLDPLVLLSVFAGLTSHARLQTGILLAALRRPAVLAKSLSTLDVLSRGRLDLGVGVGWQREEYEAAGLPFEGRGKLLDHTLEVLQCLWREGSASFDSERLRFEKIHCVPKPLQPGGVPIWVSGRINRAVLRRIVRFGSGWIPWGDDAKDPTVGLRAVREALEAAGRDATGFQVTAGLRIRKGAGGDVDVERTLEPVPGMVEAGITDFQIGQLPVPDDPAGAEDVWASFVGAFRRVVGR